MSHIQGRPFRAHVHSTDASSGVSVPIYLAGSGSVYTPSSTEHLRIHSIDLITAAGGDSYVNVGSAAGSDADEIVIRGSFAANGGVIKTDVTPVFVGQEGNTIFVTAPVGVVDVVAHGTVHQENTGGQRPSYRASQVPGS